MSKKGPDIIFIVSVAIACVIVAAAIVYVNMARTFEPIPEGVPEAVMVQGSVEIPPDMVPCGKDEHCIVVDRSCGFCCNFVAINSKEERMFDGMFKKGCKKYYGKKCSCSDLSSYPSCIEGACQLVKWPDQGGPAFTPRPQPAPQAEVAPAPAPVTPVANEADDIIRQLDAGAPATAQPVVPAPAPAPVTPAPTRSAPPPAPVVTPAPAPSSGFGDNDLNAPLPQEAPADLNAPFGLNDFNDAPAPANDDLNKPF